MLFAKFTQDNIPGTRFVSLVRQATRRLDTGERNPEKFAACIKHPSIICFVPDANPAEEGEI